MRFFDQWLPAALLLMLAGDLAWMGTMPSDGFHAFRLLSASAASLALGVLLCLRVRWARWMAIGWAIDVLANALAAYAFSDAQHRAWLLGDPLLPWVAGGAAVMLLLVGRPGARKRFEPDWTTPLHSTYRWTAIAVSVCATQAVVIGMFGLADGLWGSVVAAALTIAAIALLSWGRFVGLPLAVGAMIAFALASNVPVHGFSGSAGLRAWAYGTQDWSYFIGGGSSAAWIPALIATLAAHALAVPHLAKRAGKTQAIALVAFSIAAGALLGATAFIERFTRSPETWAATFDDTYELEPRWPTDQVVHYRRLVAAASTEELVSLSRHPRLAVRVHAVTALIERREPCAVTILVEHVDDREELMAQFGPTSLRASALTLMLLRGWQNLSEHDRHAFVRAVIRAPSSDLAALEQLRGYELEADDRALIEANEPRNAEDLRVFLYGADPNPLE